MKHSKLWVVVDELKRVRVSSEISIPDWSIYSPFDRFAVPVAISFHYIHFGSALSVNLFRDYVEVVHPRARLTPQLLVMGERCSWVIVYGNVYVLYIYCRWAGVFGRAATPHFRNSVYRQFFISRFSISINKIHPHIFIYRIDLYTSGCPGVFCLTNRPQ